MKKQIQTRQQVRQGLLLFMMFLFPVTMNYFSPYIIMDGASQGILTASPIVFGLMFLSSIFVGRLWCGWACPAGALGEVCKPVNNQPVQGKKIDWIKWAVWVPWLGAIVFLVTQSGGYHKVDLLHMTESGISVDEPIKYINYYFVLGLFILLAVIFGRRAGCHTICWMAPFMIIGRKIGNVLHMPGLHLQAEPEKCTNCLTCTTYCPMSLDVNGMVQTRSMENNECILCGSCVDGCTRNAIHYWFAR